MPLKHGQHFKVVSSMMLVYKDTVPHIPDVALEIMSMFPRVNEVTQTKSLYSANVHWTDTYCEWILIVSELETNVSAQSSTLFNGVVRLFKNNLQPCDEKTD